MRGGIWGVRAFVAGLSVLLLLGHFPLRAGEFSEEERSRIQQEVQALRKIALPAGNGKQDAAFAEMDRKCAGNPEAGIWLRRAMLVHVLNYNSAGKVDAGRRDRYIAEWDVWAKERNLDGDLLLWYQAVRLCYVDKDVFQRDIAVWFPAMERKEKWPAYAPDYYFVLARLVRAAVTENNVDGFREAIGRFERLANSPHAAHPGFRKALAEAVWLPWQKKPLIESPDVLIPRLKPLTLETAREKLTRTEWTTLLGAVIRVAPGEKDLLDTLFKRVAEQGYKDAAWVALLQSRRARAEGDGAAAARLRADAAAKAVTKAMSYDDYASLVSALREEADASLAASKWDDAMGAARALFNVARSEKELSGALELAARAAMRNDGGMEAANAFLGLVNDEAAQPAAWKEAQPNPRWRKRLEKELNDIDAANEVAAWRRRAWLALALGDGRGALAAAAAAYRLPDLSDKSQEATLETAAMAFRALSGSAAAAERFVQFQTKGPSASGEKSGLPAAPAVDAAQQIEAAWDAVKMAGERAGVKVPGEKAGVGAAALAAAVRDYAAWLEVAGRGDEALGVMRALYRWSANPKEIEQAVAGVAGMLRARDEDLVRANAWRAFQRYGPSGADGKAGTADDLVDPLAKTPGKLPDGWAAHWGKLAADLDARGSWQHAVRLWLLAGDVDAALERLQKLRAKMAFQDKAWKEHLQYATAALKAAVGHTAAGQVYADFLRYGPNGKDGKAGTEDDLADPLVDPKKTAAPSGTAEAI